MEESKNMSEAFRVYDSRLQDHSLTKQELDFLKKIIGDERWSWNWKTVLNSFEGLINWPVFEMYVHCLKWSLYSKDPNQPKIWG